MRLLFLACVPLFVPMSSPRMAPLLEAVRAEAIVTEPTWRPPTPEPEHPIPVGHRARPSGCLAKGSSGDSRSIGSPTRGELAGARFLGESELVHHVDATHCNFWGTDELVDVVQRVARVVATAHPGHRLTVGELSQPKGGEISGHASHENGRDVDLGFYFVDERGQPFEPDRFVDVRRDRHAQVGDQRLTFDVDRNWKLVEALVRDGEAGVNFVLVNGRIRGWLLAHARSIGVADELYRRAARVLIRPSRGRHPHRNHFHVRIYCSESDERCRDRGGLWAWVERARAERAESESTSDEVADDRAADASGADGTSEPSRVRSAASPSSVASSHS